MTDFKDWNEAHFNGYRARTAADFIWKDAQSQADATGAQQPGAKRNVESGEQTRGGDRTVRDVRLTANGKGQELPDGAAPGEQGSATDPDMSIVQ